MDGARFAVTSSKDSPDKTARVNLATDGSLAPVTSKGFLMSDRNSFYVLLLLGLLAVLSRDGASALLFQPRHIRRGAPTVERLQQCRLHLRSLIQVKFAHALFVRLAWHDSGTFDKVSTILCVRCTVLFRVCILFGRVVEEPMEAFVLEWKATMKRIKVSTLRSCFWRR